MEKGLKSDRSCQPPRRTVGIGEVFYYGGRNYLVVERGCVESPKYACVGCAFASVNCPQAVACSRYDRSDDTNVWFVER